MDSSSGTEMEKQAPCQVILIPQYVVINPKAMPSLPEAPLDALSTMLDRIRGIPCAGIVLAVLSGVFFAASGFIVKMIPNVNPIEIVIFRAMVWMVVYLPVILIYRMPVIGVKGERTALLMRGFFGFCAITFCYISYGMIPLADASTIVFSAPVHVSIFACIFLKEECGMFQTAIVAVTIGGVLLISKPTFLFGDHHEAVVDVAQRMKGTITAVISSLSIGLTFILIRKLRKTPAAVVINACAVVFIVVGVIAISIIMLFDASHDLSQGLGMPETAPEIGWLIGSGICGVLEQLCLTVALKVEEASLVSLSRTIDIVMAFALQVIWLPAETVQWTSLLGAFIVCFGVGVSAIRRWLKDKHGKSDTLWCIINCGMDRADDSKISSSNSTTLTSKISS